MTATRLRFGPTLSSWPSWQNSGSAVAMNIQKWLLIAFSLLQVGCTCGRIGESQPRQLFRDAGTAAVSHETGFTFPYQVGNFVRVAVHNFDSAGHDMSYGYNHMLVPVTATIYVYPKSETRPRTLLDQHFEDVCDEILARHKNAAVIHSGVATLALSGTQRRGYKAVFSYTKSCAGSVQPLRSELSLFEYQGYFLKFRFTYPARDQTQGEKEATRLMQEIKWPHLATE